MERDFTFIDDVVECVYRCGENIANNKCLNSLSSQAPYQIFNVGNSQPINLIDFINVLEEKIGKKAKKIFKSLQPGDSVATFSDSNKLADWINFKPNTSIEKGVTEFVSWYKSFYG